MRFQFGTLAPLLAFACLIFVSSANAQIVRPHDRTRTQTSPVVSKNFIVRAADPVLARKVSQEAERFRKELAVEWLGKELPNWSQKCPITVKLGMHAGGETSFAFVMDQSGRGTPIDWQMKIFGPHDRLLDAVLPHEVTHTIFATHFGQPLPRWADEGACTTVEHESERKKNHAMLMDFLHAQPSRGLPFNRMFTMRNYPHDILPLYAQGYSVAKFLILQKGKRYFLDYISSGLQQESQGHVLKAWNRATSEFYDYDDLSDLQLAWLDWVRKGSSETAFEKRGTGSSIAVAQVEKSPGDLIRKSSVDLSITSNWEDVSVEADVPQAISKGNASAGSWYVQQMQQGGAARIATNRQDLSTSRSRKKVLASDKQLSPRANQELSLPSEYRTTPKTIWR